ncbi:anti-sigma factor domain-containing protein [Paenibacillus lutrae]|uniref:Anti-sigma factor domain-containing protein n=1 Tax=Paenibacillus lutrae TaxID=2078573 RepID=A0A7X3FFH2_9BACL|nr:anti-sigma factor domain-containing protein [Paenibacillus lutrae]MVO98759.1 anti-sigma factor domain-containing protein [Paenibacillus lutrae]
MSKGIVMELKGSSIIVMTQEGRFERIPRKGRTCSVGEEITYTRKAMRRSRIYAAASGLAVAGIIFFVMIGGLLNTGSNIQVAAYVTMDINPSVELALDDAEIVREVRGLNADGSRMAEAVRVEGKPLPQATSVIMGWLEQSHLSKGEGDIIISSTVVGDSRKVSDVLLADKMEKQVMEYLRSNHSSELEKYVVAAFAAPADVRSEARTHQLSTGKYAIYLNAKSMGTHIDLEEFRNKSLYVIGQQTGGINKLIDRSNPIKKSSLNDWLAMEKKGSWNQDNTAMPKESEADPQAETAPTPTPTPVQTPVSTPPSTVKPEETHKPVSSAKPASTPTPSDSKWVNPYKSSGNAEIMREQWLKQQEERKQEAIRKQKDKEEKEKKEKKEREEKKKKEKEERDKKKHQDDDDDRDDDDDNDKRGRYDSSVDFHSKIAVHKQPDSKSVQYEIRAAVKTAGTLTGSKGNFAAAARPYFTVSVSWAPDHRKESKTAAGSSNKWR